MNRLRNIKLKCCMLLMSIIFFSPAAMPAHAEVGPINEAEAQLEILLDLELQADLGIIDLVPGDTGDLLEICESEDLYIASGDLQEASLKRRLRQFGKLCRNSKWIACMTTQVTACFIVFGSDTDEVFCRDVAKAACKKYLRT